MNYEWLMEQACNEATLSPDPSTQNGAVIVTRPDRIMIFDHNRFPTGVSESKERWGRPLKYKYVEHAERNAIYRAVKIGAVTEDATMVSPWAACSDCARAIVQSGIKTLVRIPIRNEGMTAHWQEDCEIGDVILEEGGVEIIELTDFSEITFPEIRHNGAIWDPHGELVL